MDVESSEFVVAFCSNCGELGLVLRSSGLCGDCLPADAHRVYERWYNSPAGIAYRNALFSELLDMFGKQAQVHLPPGRGRGWRKGERRIFPPLKYPRRRK